MNKITKEMISGGHVSGTKISGAILLQDVKRQLTKTKKPFFNGALMSGVSIPFRVWDNSVAFKTLESTDLCGKVVYISGTWDDYQGNYSIIVDSIIPDNSFKEEDFMAEKYDANAYWKQLQSMTLALLSDKGKAIANDTLFENKDLASRFVVEFAAKSHHDNCKSGLLAHTFKLMYLCQVALNLYGDLVDRDILVLGILFHDIGKVREMHFGSYQPCSKVTHRFLGIEMLKKDMIVDAYGEDGYYELVSIMLQHHGEWGDPCKTVSARIVNLIDEFEANMMLIKQSLEESDNCGTININGTFLSYMPKK